MWCLPLAVCLMSANSSNTVSMDPQSTSGFDSKAVIFLIINLFANVLGVVSSSFLRSSGDTVFLNWYVWSLTYKHLVLLILPYSLSLTCWKYWSVYLLVSISSSLTNPSGNRLLHLSSGDSSLSRTKAHNPQRLIIYLSKGLIAPVHLHVSSQTLQHLHKSHLQWSLHLLSHLEICLNFLSKSRLRSLHTRNACILIRILKWNMRTSIIK